MANYIVISDYCGPFRRGTVVTDTTDLGGSGNAATLQAEGAIAPYVAGEQDCIEVNVPDLFTNNVGGKLVPNQQGDRALRSTLGDSLASTILTNKWGRIILSGQLGSGT